MAELVYKGKIYSTRSRVSTLNQIIKELETEIKTTSDKNKISQMMEDIKTAKAIIAEKESKKVANKKEEKNDKPKTDVKEKKEKPAKGKKKDGEDKPDEKKKKKLTPNVTDFDKINDDFIDSYDPEESAFIDEETGDVKQLVVGLQSVSKEMRKTVVTLPDREIRNLVDFYYQIQKFRIATENQVRSLTQGYDKNDDEKNVSVMQWNLMGLRNLEDSTKLLLDEYSSSKPFTRWCKSIIGIGPVISSCLYAYFNVEDVNSAGNFWSYAGLNDNNNPWLGNTKSTAIVNELFAIRKIKNDAFTKAAKRLDIVFGNNIALNYNYDEAAITEYLESHLDTSIMNELLNLAFSIAKDDLLNYKQIDDKFIDVDGNIGEDGPDEATEELLSMEEKVLKGDVQDPTVGHINLSVPFHMGDLVDYLFSLSDKNVVSSRVLSMLYEKLNGRRKIVNIAKSAKDRKEDSKYYGLISKSSLVKYLAKPPYNIKLKVLMWKIGNSFQKVSNKEGSLYGKLYKERKEYETRKNNNYEYWEQAALCLKKKNYSKTSQAYHWYSQGMLPPAHIDARARRYAVKIFIDHMFEMMYIIKHGEMPKMVYPISRLDHVDYIEPEVPYSKFAECKEYKYPENPAHII